MSSSSSSKVRESVRSGVMIEAACKILVIAHHLVLFPIFLSSWGRTLYGEWVVLTSVTVILGLASFGLGTACGNEMVACLEREERSRSVAVFWAGLLPLSGVSLIILILGFGLAFLNWDPRFLISDAAMNMEEARTVFASSIIRVGGMIPGGVIFGALRAYRGFNFTRTWGGISQLISMIAVILALLSGVEPSFLAKFICLLTWLFLFISVVGLVAYVPDLRELPDDFRQSVSASWRRLLSPSLAFFLLPMVNLLLFPATSVLLGLYFGGSSVTGFAACRTLTSSLRQGVTLVSVPVWRSITAAAAAKNRDRVHRLMRILFLYAGIITGAGSVFLFFTVDIIFGLWLEDNFVYDKWVFRGLLVSVVFMVYGNFFGLLPHATNQNLKMTTKTLIWCALMMTAAWIALALGGGTLWVVAGLILANLGRFWFSLECYRNVSKAPPASPLNP